MRLRFSVVSASETMRYGIRPLFVHGFEHAIGIVGLAYTQFHDGCAERAGGDGRRLVTQAHAKVCRFHSIATRCSFGTAC